MNPDQIPDAMRRCMRREPTLRQPQMPRLAPETALERVLTEKPGNDSAMEHFLPCVPPTVTAQQKGASARGGKLRFFTKKKVKTAATELATILRPVVPASPLAGPLCLTITFVFPWRAAEKKAITTQYSRYPIETRPDCSNLIKLCEDVMTELGFWHDDSQVSDLRVLKYRGDIPGIGVRIAQATGEKKQQT